MTSRKSFINNFGYAYRTGLRDNVVPALMQLFFGLLVFVYMPSLELFKTTKISMSENSNTGNFEAVNIKDSYQFLLTSNMQFLRYLVIAAFLILGILMGIVTFKFMTGKKTMNVYYSLGIKRVNMFTAKYLSGLTLMAFAVFIPIAIDVIMNISVLGLNGKMISAAVYYFLGLLSLSMFSFSLTAAVFSTVGTVFEGVVFSGILVCTPAVLLSALQSLIESLVNGTPYGVVFDNSFERYSGQSLLSEFYQFSPFMYLSRGLLMFQSADKDGKIINYTSGEATAWEKPEILLVFAWIAVAVAFVFLAMFLYNRRKAEIGGFIGKNKVLNFICTFIIGFFGFVVAFSELSSISKAIRVLIAIGVFAVIYIVLDLLLIRNFKLFLKKTYKLPMHLAIALLIFTFFSTGYFGAVNKIPKTEDISYIKISSPALSYSGPHINLSWENFSFLDFDCTTNTLPIGKYESASDIEKIQEIHKTLVDRGLATELNMTENADENYPHYIKIVYTLKNGKEIKRAYYGINTETYNKLLELENSDYQRSQLYNAFYGEYKSEHDLKALKEAYKQNASEVINEININQYKRALQADDSLVIFYNKLLGGKELTLNAQQRKQLIDCVYNDITNMTAQQICNPKVTLGILGFSATDFNISQAYEDNQMDNTYSGHYEVSDNKEDPVSYKDGYTTLFDSIFQSVENSPSFFITPEMTRTISFLKSVGVYEEVLNLIPQISGVKVSKVSESCRYFKHYLNEKIEVGREFTIQLGYNEYYSSESSYLAKDQATINDLYSKARMRATLSCENGYILSFITDADGEETMKLYIDRDDLPQSIKDAIDSNIAKSQSVY